MPWFVYILFCDQRKYYVGMTEDVKKRLAQHRTGQSFYTKQFKEIDLLYFEQFKNMREAVLREKQVKGWSVAKKKALIEGDIKKLVQLSRRLEPVEG